MADPTKYVPGYSFSGFQASSPARPLPADRVDNEFALLMQSVGTLVDAVKDVRRSDGKLQNGSVGPDQLSATLSIGFTNRGTWTVGQSYAAGDGVGYGQIFYAARTTHVAAAGNRPDLDPVTWRELFSQATLSLTDGAVTTAKLADGAATTVKIANDAVTNAKLANMAAGTIKGRATSAGDPTDLTGAQAAEILPVIRYSSVQTLAGTELTQARENLAAVLGGWYEPTGLRVTGATGMSWVWDLPADAKEWRLTMRGPRAANGGANLTLRCGDAGAAAADSGASDYFNQNFVIENSAFVTGAASQSAPSPFQFAVNGAGRVIATGAIGSASDTWTMAATVHGGRPGTAVAGKQFSSRVADGRKPRLFLTSDVTLAAGDFIVEARN